MNDTDSSSVGAPSRGKKMRRSFTVGKELEIVKYAEDNNPKNGAARNFGIDRKQVQDWTKQKKQLHELLFFEL
jgi:hypothetical protein